MNLIYTSDLVGKKESVVDEMLLLNPLQIPFITMLGGFGRPISNIMHEWNEDQMFSYSSETAASIANDSVTSVTVATGDGSKFRDDHVIQVEDELMKVTGVSTDTLTVVRGYAGTTAVAHTVVGTDIEILFTEGTEGADAREARSKARTNKYNYTQIFDDSVEVSGSSVEIDMYGFDALYEYEKQKKMAELAYQLERACINGVRYSSGNVRQFGGIRNWISTNVTDASASDITKKMLNDVVQNVSDSGGLRGGRYVFMTSPTQRRKLGTLDSNSLIIDRGDKTRGETVNAVLTDLGEFPVFPNPNIRPGEMFFTDLNRVQLRPLGSRSFFHEFLGKTGDSYRGQILGEYTLEFKEESAHARIKDLNTSWS